SATESGVHTHGIDTASSRLHRKAVQMGEPNPPSDSPDYALPNPNWCSLDGVQRNPGSIPTE
ncbi:MAG: hypothetical protein ABW104_01510, partial [Candidatus Thiodiazotropha sp. 6PLUC2]